MAAHEQFECDIPIIKKNILMCQADACNIYL